jgi:hypothetical protein
LRAWGIDSSSMNTKQNPTCNAWCMHVFVCISSVPDVVGAFCYIIADTLYISNVAYLPLEAISLPRRGNVVCCPRITEQLSQKLFNDDTLVSKHAKYLLANLWWEKHLGKPSSTVPAHACSKHQGVLDDIGHPVNTPHFYFVETKASSQRSTNATASCEHSPPTSWHYSSFWVLGKKHYHSRNRTSGRQT